MSKLTCDVCGGKLIMADDRQSSKCENCGVEYTMTAMRDMIAALEGVELNVKGVATEDSLIEYALSIKSTDQDVAAKELHKALKINPQNYKVWYELFKIEEEGYENYLRSDIKFFRNVSGNVYEELGLYSITPEKYFSGFLKFDTDGIGTGKEVSIKYMVIYYFNGSTAHDYIKKAISFAPPDEVQRLKEIETYYFVTLRDELRKFGEEFKKKREQEEQKKREQEEQVRQKEKQIEQQRQWEMKGLCPRCGGKANIFLLCKTCGKHVLSKE